MLRSKVTMFLWRNLKFLRPHIRGWNREMFGRVEDRKKAALRKLNHWDDVEIQRVLNA